MISSLTGRLTARLPFRLHPGKERWAIKTLADAAGQALANAPHDTTVEALLALPRPVSAPRNGRLGIECQVVRVRAWVRRFHLEEDGDVHVVLSGTPAKEAPTMIAELVEPTFIAPGNVWLPTFTRARQAFIALYGRPIPSFKHAKGGRVVSVHKPDAALSGPVLLTGVVFFDYLHGQDGMAHSGVELHPVLAVEKA